MTRDETLAEFAPKFLRGRMWERRIIIALGFAAVIALPIAIVSLIGTIKTETRVTQIQHSACAANPAGLECQKIKAASDRNQPVRFACIPFHKAGYPCPKPGSEAAKKFDAEGGDALQPGSTGSQPASPPPGGHTGEGVSNPPNSPQEPSNPVNPPSTPAPGGVAPSPSSPPVSEPSPEPTPEAAKAPIRETVAGVGETVNGAFEGVGDTGCKLLGCKP